MKEQLIVGVRRHGDLFAGMFEVVKEASNRVVFRESAPVLRRFREDAEQDACILRNYYMLQNKQLNNLAVVGESDIEE